jgi:hypothetical protein
MTCIKGVSVACLAAALAGSAMGQTTLYVVKTENFNLLSTAAIADPNNPPPATIPNPDNTFWIGHNPASIAYGKGRLFIGGFVSGTALPRDGADADGDSDTAEVTPFNASIVKVNNILTTRSFNTVPGSRTSAPNSRGYTGLDYSPNVGSTVRGLVASVDINSGANILSRYDVDLVGNGVLAAPVPSLITGFRLGSCGPAWDFGPAGLGVDYLSAGSPGQDGIPDGPGVLAMDFGARGPYGTDPNTLNANVGATLYEATFNNGIRLVADGAGNTQWRDLDVDPRNGSVAARANNSVILAQRNPDGTAAIVDLNPSPTSTRIEGANFPTTVINGQNVQIMHGFGDAGVGDLLVWNDRGTGDVGQAFTSVFKLNRTDGTSVSYTLLNPDSTPASLPANAGYLDFAWDQATQVLFVLDFTGRNVYVLSHEQPRACCLSSGACFLLNPTACGSAEVGGIAGASGSSCSPNPCAQPTIACCFADGTCQNLDSAACTTAGGTAQGSGSTCAPNPCPQPTGACCNGSICTETTAGGCTGTFQGVGSTCTPDPCAVTTGACCCGSTCTVSAAAACTGPNSFFAGAGVACNAPGNNTTPCCKSDFNHAGGAVPATTVQDIFDFLQTYFATPSGQPSCADINAVGGTTVQDIFDFLQVYFSATPGGC